MQVQALHFRAHLPGVRLEGARQARLSRQQVTTPRGGLNPTPSGWRASGEHRGPHVSFTEVDFSGALGEGGRAGLFGGG